MNVKEYMNAAASLNCVICGAHGVQLHHAREGCGMAQRASDWLVCAICPECHTGSRGIHGDRSILRLHKLDEMDLLARTIAGVFKSKGR